METLIPDFQGITKHIDRLIEVSPEVISHNMETVKRLGIDTPEVVELLKQHLKPEDDWK